MLSVNSTKKQRFFFFPQVLSSNSLCCFLCVKGDASKSGSEIDSCARSMEDVNDSKKDLSASAGETAHAVAYTDNTLHGCLNQ